MSVANRLVGTAEPIQAGVRKGASVNCISPESGDRVSLIFQFLQNSYKFCTTTG